MAWRRLRPTTHAFLLDACWKHVHDRFVPAAAESGTEREAWLTAMTLRRLLDQASPDELIALSKHS